MKERRLAKCREFDFGVHDNYGFPLIYGNFQYDGGGCQGFGYRINIEFLERFISVFGVERLREVNGRACFVTSSHSKIHLVEPLFAGEGKPFDVDAWVEEAKKKLDAERKTEGGQ